MEDEQCRIEDGGWRLYFYMFQYVNSLTGTPYSAALSSTTKVQLVTTGRERKITLFFVYEIILIRGCS